MELKVNKPAGDPSREEKLHAARRRMADLATRFLDRSSDDLATMRAALQRFETGDASGVADIRHLAHRMVGTGATLGFDALAECAHRIEKFTETLAPGILPDETTRAGLADGLAAMQSELGKLRGG
jgi:HPt (histidine-containing phosphotransfer) domain-containing protein